MGNSSAGASLGLAPLCRSELPRWGKTLPLSSPALGKGAALSTTVTTKAVTLPGGRGHSEKPPCGAEGLTWDFSPKAAPPALTLNSFTFKPREGKQHDREVTGGFAGAHQITFVVSSLLPPCGTWRWAPRNKPKSGTWCAASNSKASLIQPK